MKIMNLLTMCRSVVLIICFIIIYLALPSLQQSNATIPDEHLEGTVKFLMSFRNDWWQLQETAPH